MATGEGAERRFYDYIVVGCGGIGSATVYWLSKRAKSGVLGIEQFELGHSNGGSQDHSRIIRNCYHDEIYTRIAPETYTAWAEAERESGIQLVYKTGGLLLADKGKTDDLITRTAAAMDKCNLPYEIWSGSQLRQKYPQFHTDDRHVIMYQKDGGLVDAQTGNAVHVQLARGNGASFIEKCPVLRFEKGTDGLTVVHTVKGKFYCRKAIVTAGAWLNNVLGSVGVHIPVKVSQEQVTYYATPHMKEFTKDKFPVWIYNAPEHDFYGLPIHGNTGSKIGVDSCKHEVTANTRSFVPDPVRENLCTDLFKDILPQSVGPILYSKTCLYTMPPDRNFVIDTCHRTGFKDVIVCNGAGHAFKWAGLLGKILSELALDGKTQYNIEAFTLDRPALKDPNYKPLLGLSGQAKL